MLNPDPRLSDKVVSNVFKENSPKQDDTIHELKRQDAQEELLKKVGSSRKGTESEQTPWYTLWK